MTLRLLTLFLSLLLIGCQKSGPGPGEPIVTIPRPVVEVALPTRREIIRTLELPGDALPFQEALLYAKTAGYLTQVLVDVGDSVRAGQLLAQLEAPELAREVTVRETQAAAGQAQTRTARAELTQAGLERLGAAAEVDRSRVQIEQARAELAQREARLAIHRQTHERLRRIYDLDPGLLARQELDVAWGSLRESQAAAEAGRQGLRAARLAKTVAQSQAQVISAQVAVNRSRADSQALQGQAVSEATDTAREWERYTQIRAPFSGVITERYLHPGALVQSAAGSAQSRTQPILALADVRRLRVTLHIPEAEASRVARGSRVRIRGGGQTITARLTRVSDRLDAATRSVRAEIEVDNRRSLLKAGALVRVELELERRQAALCVPAGALVREKDRRFVWLVAQGKAQKTPVKIGFESPERVEVLEGLKGTEEVVVSGRETLTPGLSVEVRAPH